MESPKHSDEIDGNQKALYRIGSVAAIIVVALTAAEIVGFIIYPPPDTVEEWLLLFQRNRILGLFDFWGLELPMYAMFILVFLALSDALEGVRQSQMRIAVALVLVGATVFFATNNPLTMLVLSDQHAAATSEAQRSAILAAGHAVLANTNQRAIGGFNIALFLVSVAGLIVSAAMLRSNAFSKATAIVGLVAFGFSLADYLRQALTSAVAIALLVILPGAVFLVIWFSLVGRRLFQLAKGQSAMGNADGAAANNNRP